MTEGPIAAQIIKFALPVFGGNLFQQLYNMVDSLIVGNFVGDEALAAVAYTAGASIFQAVGDSRHPLYYLVISSVLNVILDLLFVAVFRWGIGGAAFATVISQFASCVLA